MAEPVQLRRLTAGDAGVLARVAEGVFDHPVIPELAAEFLADPRHHLVVALDAGVVVGFASAVHYVHPDKPAELWVNEVGVAPPHRRRGLGRLLVENLLSLARRLGCREAWVLTERDNEPAKALYRSMGGGAASPDVMMFSFSLQADAG